MDINLTVKIEAPELATAIQALATALSGTKLEPVVNNIVNEQAAAAEPLKEEKPKRERKQTEKPVTEEPANAPEPVEEETPQEESAPEENQQETQEEPSEPEYIPSVVELRAKAQEKGKTPDGKKAIKALLDKFGSKSISDVQEEYRASFLGMLEAL